MTLGSHQTSIGKSQSHITPRWILDALGPFDLDPAAADPRPWACAKKSYSEADDGLSKRWSGRVFLKLANHGRGIALLHARTETDWFLPIWRGASGILFLANRIHFHLPDGTRHPANSGAPPVIAAFGAKDLAALRESGIAGALVTRWVWQQ
jgi:hypothetical protein